jgi:cellulose synthase/poly-beta-1,6-N-acetylglucosamine synthase-like glycosyltransferase
MPVVWNTIWIIIQVLIGYQLVIPVVLYLVQQVTGKKRLQVTPANLQEADYGIIVTAYEHTNTLQAVVQSILQLKYSNYIVYIVADKCDVSELQFSDDRVVVLRPPETLGSNTRSHFYAIHRFIRPHERMTIIDSDNLVHPDYLNQLNQLFAKGFKAVQGVRAAKNLDTTYACLDAARDLYYHFYDGKVLFTVGSSATLAGSGMAFETQLYRDCLEHRDVTGAGFDKVLQAAIVEKDLRIAFAEAAIVYDEKTSGSTQLVMQRARWINTWFRYFSFGFHLLAAGIKNASSNQFWFGLILLRPPLFIFLLLSVLCLLINLVMFNMVATMVWVLGLLLFVAGFAIALAQPGTDRRIYRSLVNIPGFIFYQVISLLKVRGANKRSVATQHYHAADIDHVLPNKKD